jgi:hypothetical protein
MYLVLLYVSIIHPFINYNNAIGVGWNARLVLSIN